MKKLANAIHRACGVIFSSRRNVANTRITASAPVTLRNGENPQTSNPTKVVSAR